MRFLILLLLLSFQIYFGMRIIITILQWNLCKQYHIYVFKCPVIRLDQFQLIKNKTKSRYAATEEKSLALSMVTKSIKYPHL